MTSITLWRWVTLISFFFLLALILSWNTLIAPPERAMVVPILLFQALPLMFPLRGILHGRAYTHAWTSFLALYYFFIGVGDAYSDDTDRLYGLMMIAASVGLFVGAMFYARFKGKSEQAERAQSDRSSDSDSGTDNS
ncbi:MAG: DUF2069 domain-containing protein [Pseudomonadota bacterium]